MTTILPRRTSLQQMPEEAKSHLVYELACKLSYLPRLAPERVNVMKLLKKLSNLKPSCVKSSFEFEI